MDRNSSSVAMLFGRMLLSFIFIISWISKIPAFDATAAVIAAKGIPYSSIMLIIATAAEALGSLMVLFGWYTRLGATIIFLFVLVITPVMHNFWVFTGSDAQIQMILFLKNLAIMGGMLYIMAAGGGRFSIDGRRIKIKA